MLALKGVSGHLQASRLPDHLESKVSDNRVDLIIHVGIHHVRYASCGVACGETWYVKMLSTD